MPDISAIKVRAEGKLLYNKTGDARLADAGKMPLADLVAALEAVKSGKGKATPAKAATSNGSKGKTAPAKAAVTTAVKGKAAAAPTKGKGSASTSAPAKSTAQKSSPAKGKAATGTAKRPTAAAGKGKATTTQAAKPAVAKGRASAAPAKGKATTTSTKGKTAATTAKRPAANTAKRSTGKGLPARQDIDRRSVNWRAESKVGQTGKRKEVMDLLRLHKGDYDKVYDKLEAKAGQFYKGHENPKGMLRWLIGRVAYDFVKNTGQHTSGVRAGYGESTLPKDIRRRELRAERAQSAAKAERAAARGKTATAKGKATPAKGKATPAKAPARKPAAAARGKAPAPLKGKGRG